MGQSGSASEQSNIMIVPLLLLGLAASSPVDRHARQTSMVLVRAGEGQRLESRQSDVEDIKVPAGEAVDIFYRYGFFSLSVRVVPRDDHGSWLIREPTTKVFTPNSLRQVKELRAGKFEPQFQIFFCDDVEDLMKHYFHDFTAEGVAEPYRENGGRAKADAGGCSRVFQDPGRRRGECQVLHRGLWQPLHSLSYRWGCGLPDPRPRSVQVPSCEAGSARGQEGDRLQSDL